MMAQSWFDQWLGQQWMNNKYLDYYQIKFYILANGRGNSQNRKARAWTNLVPSICANNCKVWVKMMDGIYLLFDLSGHISGETLVVADWAQSIGFFSHEQGQLVQFKRRLIIVVLLFKKRCIEVTNNWIMTQVRSIYSQMDAFSFALDRIKNWICTQWPEAIWGQWPNWMLGHGVWPYWSKDVWWLDV